MFTDRKKWRKNVDKKVINEIGGRTFLYFEYQFIKLFELEAKDFYNYSNPVVKVLLPKMNYPPEERFEVISQAYKGLFELASRSLFERYIDFIDIYAEVEPKERETICNKLEKRKETEMLAQYIEEKGIQKGIEKGEISLLTKQIARKYNLEPNEFSDLLKNLKVEELENLGEKIVDYDEWERVLEWIKNLS